MITFLGCFKTQKERPHWIGIKEGCNGFNVNFIDPDVDEVKSGDIGIACTRGFQNYLNKFKYKLYWNNDYRDNLEAKKDRITLTTCPFNLLQYPLIQYLPQGSPEKQFIKTKRKKDIVFVGNTERSSNTGRTKFIKELQKKYNIDTIFNRWDLENIYPYYKIALSLNREDDSYACSNRPYLIQGYSGFCLARENKLMKETFDNGVVYFTDIDDCMNKIDYYLKHSTEHIRYQGWQEIQDKHLYKYRINKIVEICEKLLF